MTVVSLVVSKSVKMIEKNAINTLKLKEIIVDKKNKWYYSTTEYLIDKRDMSIVMYCNGVEKMDIVFPKEILSVRSGVFEGNQVCLSGDE